MFLVPHMSKIKDDAVWRGWPLPWNQQTDNMPDINLYAIDCMKFAKLFLKVSGLLRAEPRQLPGQAAASASRSLEERTGPIERCLCF